MTRPRTLVDLSKVRHITGGSGWLDSILGEGKSATHQTPPEPTEWILDFAYATTPISPNGSRGSHHAHAKKVSAVRTVAAREARQAGIPALGMARAELTWYVLRNARRDPVNLALTLKAMVDGLVDAGVTVDDTPDLMDTPMPRIVKVDPIRNGTAWMELRITPWEGLNPEPTGPKAPELHLALRLPPEPPEAA